MRINSGIFFRQSIQLFVFLLLCAGYAPSQEWTRMDVDDPRQGRQYIEFTLRGEFAKAPHVANDVFPLMILHCQKGSYSSGHLRGKLLGGVLHVGRITNDSIVRDDSHEDLFSSKIDPDGYYVEFSYDDGEPQSDHWDNALDYRGIGFGQEELSGILWAQKWPHKEDSGLPVKKFSIRIQPPEAGQILLQFNLPDPTAVSELCGCTYFKKKN